MNLCQRTVDPRNFTHSDDVVFSVSTTRNLHRFGEIVPCLSANEKNETTLNPHCFSSRSTRYSELLGSLQVWILYSTVANNGTDIIESTATRCTAQNSTVQTFLACGRTVPTMDNAIIVTPFLLFFFQYHKRKLVFSHTCNPIKRSCCSFKSSTKT